MNAAVLTIVITAFITSIGTRYFAHRVTPPSTDHRDLGEHVLLDARNAGSDQTLVATFAGELARPDGGVVMPYAVSDGDDAVEARRAVDGVAARAAELGLDVEGEVRVDDSFVDASIHLVTERRASCIVLEWEGLQWVTDYLYGNDIDAIGVDSPVPCLAVRLLRPWNRVVVPVGTDGSSWRGDDARLALDVARRARATVGLPLVVVGDPAVAGDVLQDDPDDLTIERGDDVTIAGIGPSDLVVVPAFKLRELPPWRARVVAKALADTNVVVVGGPHRLSVSRPVFAQHVSGLSSRPGPVGS